MSSRGLLVSHFVSKWRSHLGILAILVLHPLSLCAQHPPVFEVFAEGGGSFLSGGSGTISLICVQSPCPTEPVEGSFSKSGRLFTGLRVRLTSHHAFEFGYSFSPNRLRVREAASSQDIGPGFNRVHNLNFNYVGYLVGRGPVQPFFTGGVGLNRFAGSNFSNGNQVAYNFGGGIDFPLIHYLSLRVELRDFLAAQPGPLEGTSHNVVPSAGIVIRFK
jgi:hypothetical protein